MPRRASSLRSRPLPKRAALPRTKPWLIGGFYLALGAGLEITQIFGIVSGTFQVKDLFANVAGVLAALAPLALAKRKAR